MKDKEFMDIVTFCLKLFIKQSTNLSINQNIDANSEIFLIKTNIRIKISIKYQ